MKKLTVFLAVAVLVLSFGIANAADSSKIPQSFQEKYIAATGTQATTAEWVSFVPVIASYNWDSFVILSNFNSSSLTVVCEFTSYSSEQTTKTYTLPFFSKRIVDVGSEIGTETIFDVYCYANNLFGLTALLFEKGALAAALPTLMLAY